MDHTGDPSDEQAEGNESVDYQKIMKDLKERERELMRRTENMESMMSVLTNALSGLRLPAPSTSTPVEQIPAGFALPHLHFQTPQKDFHPTLPLLSPSPSVSPYPKSYIRDALELVPKYDGHSIPVWQFARACKRAKESIPLVDEAHLVGLLRNKLTHHAYLAVEDEIHPTVDKFLDTLKRTFGPGRSANYYRGQLSIAYKKPAEHILDYIGRIKDLRTSIIEGDQTNLDRPLTESEISSIDSFALEAFYEGLPRECRVELRAEGYSNLADACTKVIVISKRLEREDARDRHLRTSRVGPSPTHTSPSTSNPRDPLNNPSQNNSNTPPGNSDNAGQKICGYCKNFGHLIHECRKRRYQNNFNNNSTRAPRQYNIDNGNDPASQNGINHSGNQPGVSANGTHRGLGTARPIYSVENQPNPSTSSEPSAGMYPLSNSNLLPLADQPRSC